jgi:hypothetical protein
MGRLLRRGGAVVALDAVLALGVLSFAIAAPWHGSAAATSPVTLTNSRDGQPIFSARDLRPGDETTGAVSIGNPSAERVAVTLGGAVTGDTAGDGGSPLGFRVQLKVLDVTGAPTTVYSGPAASLRSLPLGTFAPHERRRYEFHASLPDGGDADNALQGAALTTAFTWTATALAPAPTAAPAPPPPPAPAPAPTATPAHGAPLTAASVIRFPRTLSGTRLTVKLVTPAGESVRAAHVKVGRGKVRRYGHVTRVKLDLRKLHGRVAVSVTVTLSDGTRLSLTKTYRRR